MPWSRKKGNRETEETAHIMEALSARENPGQSESGAIR
jgi:hypothetical protein